MTDKRTRGPAISTAQMLLFSKDVFDINVNDIKPLQNT